MKSNIRSVQYNFIMNFLVSATSIIFPMITFPYVTRVLQTSGMGKVSFATSVANYFIMAANLGIPTYGIRACARVRDNKMELTKVAHEIFIINTATTVMSILIFALSVALVPQIKEEKTLFYINGIGIVLNLFGVQWLYQALEQYDYIAIRSVGVKIISIVLMFLLVCKESDYVVYGAITVFAASGANILNFVRARHYISFRRQSEYRFRRHIKPIMVLFAQTMVVSIYTNLDTVMLGFLRDNSEVGLYTTAVKVKTVLVSLVASLSTVLLPRVSNVVKTGDSKHFGELTRKALDCTMLMALPLSIYFTTYAKESVLFLAGDSYLAAVVAMQIITLAVVPNGLTGVLGIQILTALEKEKYVLYSVITGAVSDFMLNIWLIPSYGAAGAALATTIAEFLVLFVQIYYTRSLIFPMIRELHILCYAVGAIMGLAVSKIVMYVLPDQTLFISLCISAISFFGTYFLVLHICQEPLLSRFEKVLKIRLRISNIKGD